MNAETAPVIVDVVCPDCNKVIGHVHDVTHYHRVETVFTPEGETPRVTDLDRGLVVTGSWHDDATPQARRPTPPHDVEWPIGEDQSAYIWCKTDGPFRLVQATVEGWRDEVRHAKKRLRRVATR